MSAPPRPPLLPAVSVRPDDNFRTEFGITDLDGAHAAMANLRALFARPGHTWAADAEFSADWDGFQAAAEYTVAYFAQQENSPDASRHLAHDDSAWIAVNTAPDLCRVGRDILPFDTFARIDRPTTASPNTFARGTPAYRVGDLHCGVQGNAGQHIVSGVSQAAGHVRFLTGQSNVRINGKPAVRHDSLCLINCDAQGQGGAPGKLMTQAIPGKRGREPQSSASARSTEATPTSASTSSATAQGPISLSPGAPAQPGAALQALLNDAADTRSVWQKTRDAGASLADGAQRLGRAAIAQPGDAGLGLLKGIANLPSDLWNLAMLLGHHATVPGQLNQHLARQHEAAALAAWQQGQVDLANTLAERAAQQREVGYVDDLFPATNDAQRAGALAAIAVPVGSIVKAGSNAARAGRVAQAADTSADTARASEAAGGLHVMPRGSPIRGADILGKTDGGPGEWVRSPRRSGGIEYQEHISGVERGIEYRVNGVLFDGYDAQRGVLLDAKDWKKFPPEGKDFWWDSTMKEATNQVNAAAGRPIEWHFSTPSAKSAVDELFDQHGMFGIKTVHSAGNR